MTLPQDWRVYVVLIAGALGVYFLAKRELGAAAQAVNPLNQDNVFHVGVNAAGAAVTGDRDFSLGSRIWEWWNPERVEAERRAIGATAGAPR
jgi:hypothetical protein